MKKPLSQIILSACLLTMAHFAGAQEINPLSVFEPFIGKTWAVAGTWGDGSIFMQEVTMQWGLNQSVVKVETQGFIDPDRTKIGERNFGVRRYNEENERIDFHEFDTFGGYTRGYVEVKGKDFYYIYEYGESTFADLWEYIDEETYRFRVVNYDNDEIGDLYLDTQYRLKQ